MNSVINTFSSKILAWVPAVAVAMVLSTSAMTVRAADEPAAAPAATAPAPDASAPAAAPADATAAPAAAAPGAPAAGGQETVENPYGLDNLWKTGDFLSHTTVIVLGIMSMGTWYILIMRLIDQTILMRQAATAQKSFWAAGSLKEGLTKLEANSAFRAIVDDGLKAAEHHEGKLTDAVDLNEWVTMSLARSTDAVNGRLQGGLSFLASVGSTAPFVGLLGTVWGIYHALIKIGLAGQASIDKVAGPVGEALIMTAFGLIVAVPAVLGYNWLVRRNKLCLERVRNFASDIHAVLLSGAKSAAPARARA
jgi:biopolymer transport protein ExbB